MLLTVSATGVHFSFITNNSFNTYPNTMLFNLYSMHTSIKNIKCCVVKLQAWNTIYRIVVEQLDF